MNKGHFLFCLIVFSICSCVEVQHPHSQLPPGVWRAELQIGEEDVLPFNFLTSYDDQGQLQIDVINGEEKKRVSEVSFGKTKDLRDTVIMSFELLDSYISAEYKENVIEGYWHRNNRDNYSIPFVAYFGQSHRFTTLQKPPTNDLSGKWEATFEVETEDAYPAIGEFVQDGNNLAGTFMTETGDYRYLQGTIQGNKFSLSCFDGGHAFLFDGTVTKDKTIVGRFLSGNHYKTNWIATRNENAKLKDPYQLSQITTPDKKIAFSLPNPEGKMISLDDLKYQNKAKLVTIMGTWCPNCLDESKFLVSYLKENPDLDIEIIALLFEKYRDKDKAISIIRNYKKRLSIPYEMLLAGYYDKAEATKDLGFIDEILSYPTLLFVDKHNVVKRVYTGYNGPATSEYKDFVKGFDAGVRELSDGR